MACHLSGTKLLSKPQWLIVNSTLETNFDKIWNKNFNNFLSENAYENAVCNKVAIQLRLEMF